MLGSDNPCPALQQLGGASKAAAMEGRQSSIGATEQGVAGLQDPFPLPPPRVPVPILSFPWAGGAPGHPWPICMGSSRWHKQMYSPIQEKQENHLLYYESCRSLVNLRKGANRKRPGARCRKRSGAPSALGAKRAGRGGSA